MKRKRIIGVFVLILVLTACGSPKGDDHTAQTQETTEGQRGEKEEAMTNPQVITSAQAYEMMQDGEEMIILDVRTQEEYEQKHIPGAVLLPNETITDEPPALLPVKDARILIYCRSGNRSAQAAAKLADMGYTRLYDFGGIHTWEYETESGAAQVQDKQGTLSSFTAVDLAGVRKDESMFADYRLTMINLWGTFCGPCLSEMPELGELAQEYEEKGVQMVGIVVDVPLHTDGTYDDKTLRTARELVEQTKADYIHLLPSEDLIHAKLKDVNAVPETIFVDEKGNQIGESYLGARSKEEWKEIIDSLL